MSLTIEISPDTEQRLAAEAARRGVEPATLVVRFLDDGLAAAADATGGSNPYQSTLELLRRWDEEDAHEPRASPEEAQREWEEFRDAMNAHSTRGYPIFP